MKKQKEKKQTNGARAIEALRRTVKSMVHLSDLIVLEGGPKEICDLIKQHGERALDSTKRYSEDNK